MWRWRRWWGGSTDTTLSTDTITIESQGGTIQLSNGAATTIDSGILTETTTINSSEHSSPLTTIENAESLTSTYQLEIPINKIADSSGSTIGTAWSMLKLPDTGQTTSYTTTFGEDHDYTINSPSYTDNGNGTITDNVTGLMWVKSPDSTTRAWANALTYANGLNLCGHDDWRLPNVNELESLINAEQSNTAAWLNTQGFSSNVQSGYYWSSTTYASSAGNAWSVNISNGYVYYYFDKANYYYILPVRAGQ